MLRRVLFLALGAWLAAGPATAGVDIDFGAAVPVGDDGALFLSVSSRYFDRDRAQVEDWSRRWYRDPDDLAVALFVGRHCDRDPEFIFSLRKEGVGWFEIANRCRVPVDAFFVPVEREPGPPYGKAYGHWLRNRHDRRHVIVLDDDDVRRLVSARMLHEYYGVPIETAMSWRAGGRNVREVVAHRYRERHGEAKGRGRDGDGGKDHGKGKGPDKDHGKGKGKGKGNEKGR